jgi:hypothetical protein
LETALHHRARAEHLESKLTEAETSHTQTLAKLAEAEASHMELVELQTQLQTRLAETESALAELTKRRSKLQSLKESLRAVGYIALPYNARRRTKRKALMTGLTYRVAVGEAIESGTVRGVLPEPPKKRSRLESIRRGLKAIGYIIFPYNQRRRKKRKALMSGLR